MEWESEDGAVSAAERKHAETEVFERPGEMRLELPKTSIMNLSCYKCRQPIYHRGDQVIIGGQNYHAKCVGTHSEKLMALVS